VPRKPSILNMVEAMAGEACLFLQIEDERSDFMVAYLGYIAVGCPPF